MAVVAFVVDLIYQLIVLHALHPLEAVLVASALALLPYALARGIAARVARAWLSRQSGPAAGRARSSPD